MQRRALCAKSQGVPASYGADLGSRRSRFADYGSQRVDWC
jgi:hypothetical protein